MKAQKTNMVRKASKSVRTNGVPVLKMVSRRDPKTGRLVRTEYGQKLLSASR
jgi:hypothetical protein